MPGFDAASAATVYESTPSQVRHPLLLGAFGVAALLLGLHMMLRPRRAARPSQWQFKSAEPVEASDFMVGVVCVFGVVWTIGGLVVVGIAVFG